MGSAIASLFGVGKRKKPSVEEEQLLTPVPVPTTGLTDTTGAQAGARVAEATERERRARAARRRGGRQGSVLTSFLGLNEPAPTARRSLLGR